MALSHLDLIQENKITCTTTVPFLIHIKIQGKRKANSTYLQWSFHEVPVLFLLTNITVLLFIEGLICKCSENMNRILGLQ